MTSGPKYLKMIRESIEFNRESIRKIDDAFDTRQAHQMAMPENDGLQILKTDVLKLLKKKEDYREYKRTLKRCSKVASN